MNGVYVCREDWGYCKGCGKWKDRREGYCYECCLEAELKAGLITESQYLKELDRVRKIERIALKR